MKRLTTALFGAILVPGLALAGDTTMQAQEFLREGRAAEAVKLLEPVPSDKTVDADYAYLLGTAAIEARQFEKAIIYLQRVVALNSAHAGARLDLGRAYFGLGSAALAEREFRAAERANPPPAALATIKQYLAAIEQRQTRATPGLAAYVEAGIGYDGNITSVTGDFTNGALAAYNLAGVVPTGNSIKRADGYASLGGGLTLSQPLTAELSLIASLDARSQNYFSKHDFDSQTLSERVGVAYVVGQDLFRAVLNGQQYGQKAAAAPVNNNRSSLGLTAEWYRNLDAQNRVGTYYQFSEYRYATQATQNVDQDLFGANWLHAFSGSGAPQVSLNLYQSNDKARQVLNLASGAKVDKTVTGLSVYGQYSLDRANDIFVQAAYSLREDKSANARSTVLAFGRDDLWSIAAGAVRRFDKNWSLRGQIAYSDNRSNIALYQYQRADASVTLRYDFR